ncbi:MAG: aminotransferase class III-fold pyridoxal phosphate-dependent enzyme, partial [Candidatus Aenigmarchaeota archaeon]|nr:aminotransferase class III-fold pyridoxal phosphate-dependent enzyme [Candidatus Aenigmarchaeota archaeon]
KPLIAKFEGHYHGTYDDVLVSTTPAPGEGGPVAEPIPVSSSRGIPEEVYKNTVVLPFNDLEAAEKIIRKNRDRLACVIMELVSKGYVPADREFARGIRELTEDLGILLIVDEVLTGFRVHYRGAQHVYGIKPDITCLGKVVGGGVPLSVVAGRKEIMKVVAPASRDSEKFVYHSGTYNGSTIGLSYGLATLEVLGREGIYPRLMRNTESLKKGLGGVFSDAGIPARLQGMGGMFNLLFCAGEVKRHRDTFKEDMLKRAVFDCTLLLNGVYVVPARRFNISVVHSAEDLKRTMSAAMKAAEAIAR